MMSLPAVSFSGKFMNVGIRSEYKDRLTAVNFPSIPIDQLEKEIVRITDQESVTIGISYPTQHHIHIHPEKMIKYLSVGDKVQYLDEDLGYATKATITVIPPLPIPKEGNLPKEHNLMTWAKNIFKPLLDSLNLGTSEEALASGENQQQLDAVEKAEEALRQVFKQWNIPEKSEENPNGFQYKKYKAGY